MIKETNACMIQCDKCKDYLEINNDMTILFGSKEALIETVEKLGWIILETGEAICEHCLNGIDILFDDEKYCMSIV